MAHFKSRDFSKQHPSIDIPREANSIVGIASGLTIKIVELLIGPQAEQSCDKHRHLRLELKALHEVLVLTGTVIQGYENRPLGQSLVKVVTPGPMSHSTWRTIRRNQRNVTVVWPQSYKHRELVAYSLADQLGRWWNGVVENGDYGDARIASRVINGTE